MSSLSPTDCERELRTWRILTCPHSRLDGVQRTSCRLWINQLLHSLSFFLEQQLMDWFPGIQMMCQRHGFLVTDRLPHPHYPILCFSLFLLVAAVNHAPPEKENCPTIHRKENLGSGWWIEGCEAAYAWPLNSQPWNVLSLCPCPTAIDNAVGIDAPLRLAHHKPSLPLRSR